MQLILHCCLCANITMFGWYWAFPRFYAILNVAIYACVANASSYSLQLCMQCLLQLTEWLSVLLLFGPLKQQRVDFVYCVHLSTAQTKTGAAACQVRHAACISQHCNIAQPDSSATQCTQVLDAHLLRCESGCTHSEGWSTQCRCMSSRLDHLY